MSGIISGVGRALIALLFIASGAAKLLSAHAIETTIAVAGLARQLVIPSGVFELIAGLCLAFGIATRLVSLLLIVFLVVATAAMGNPMADPLLLAVGLRNLAIIGGLLAVFAAAEMAWDYRLMAYDRDTALADRNANERVHEAELRAARAERAATGQIPPPPRRAWWSRW